MLQIHLIVVQINSKCIYRIYFEFFLIVFVNDYSDIMTLFFVLNHRSHITAETNEHVMIRAEDL